MQTITAAVAHSDNKAFAIENLRLDAPRADEMLVRVAAVGICHTDLWMRDSLDGDVRAVLGHEGAGVIEEVGGAITRFKPGDRVALTFRSCGSCFQCRDAHPAYCDKFFPMNFGGSRADGSRTISNGDDTILGSFFGQSSFADRAIVSEQNAIRIPEEIPFEIAAPLGCGVQTGAGAIMNAMRCSKGSSLLVLGGGSVGLSAVMAAAVQGCGSVIVLEPHADRRCLALEIGATHTIDPSVDDVADAIRAVAPGGVNYALDTTGRLDVIEQGIAQLSARGVLGLVAAGSMNFDLSQLVPLGKTVMGIIEGDSQPETFIPGLIELYSEGRFPIDRLIATYPFTEINRAIEDQHAGRCVKPVLIF